MYVEVLTMKKIAKIKKAAFGASQKVGALIAAPTKELVQFGLFAFGLTLLSLGTVDGAHALLVGGAGGTAPGAYNDARIDEVINRIFDYIEGAFGALIMVAAGIGAIFSAAIGQYRTALGLLVVAVGAFILRSLVSTFFDDAGIAA